jgi:hypothetical protein
MSIRHLALPFLLGAALLVGGCGGCDNCGAAPGGQTPFNQVPDFTLSDVNPNSTTHQAPVSPRNYVGSVSAWYFSYGT